MQKQFNVKRRIFSINGAGTIVHPHAKKKKKKKNFNPYLPPYIVSNQMDHRPKYKT